MPEGGSRPGGPGHGGHCLIQINILHIFNVNNIFCLVMAPGTFSWAVIQSGIISFCRLVQVSGDVSVARSARAAVMVPNGDGAVRISAVVDVVRRWSKDVEQGRCVLKWRDLSIRFHPSLICSQ